MKKINKIWLFILTILLVDFISAGSDVILSSNEYWVIYSNTSLGHKIMINQEDVDHLQLDDELEPRRESKAVQRVVDILPTKSSYPGYTSYESYLRQMLIMTVVFESYFLSYAYILGSSLAGDIISGGGSSRKSTGAWLGASITGGFIGWGLAELTGLGERKRVSGLKKNDSKLEMYRIIYIGPNIAKINDFKAESVMVGPASGPMPGQPLWTASAREVDMGRSFASAGYRIGALKGWAGWDVELSISSHQTTKQKVFYDANGFVYVKNLGYVPVPLDWVELPERFLMVRTLGYGGNFFIHPPRFKIVKPYIGFGLTFLVNSIQSEYAGPANLSRGEEGLALSTVRAGWGFQIPIGMRVYTGKSIFLYGEFRPVRHYVYYKSGQGDLQEYDSFALQMFQTQFGLGFMFR